MSFRFLLAVDIYVLGGALLAIPFGDSENLGLYNLNLGGVQLLNHYYCGKIEAFVYPQL